MGTYGDTAGTWGGMWGHSGNVGGIWGGMSTWGMWGRWGGTQWEHMGTQQGRGGDMRTQWGHGGGGYGGTWGDIGTLGGCGGVPKGQAMRWHFIVTWVLGTHRAQTHTSYGAGLRAAPFVTALRTKGGSAHGATPQGDSGSRGDAVSHPTAPGGQDVGGRGRVSPTPPPHGVTPTKGTLGSPHMGMGCMGRGRPYGTPTKGTLGSPHKRTPWDWTPMGWDPMGGGSCGGGGVLWGGPTGTGTRGAGTLWVTHAGPPLWSPINGPTEWDPYGMGGGSAPQERVPMGGDPWEQ